MTQQFRTDCLPSGNALKSENAALIVTTFVHNRSGFKQDGTADNELENGWGCYDLRLQNANLVLKAEELGYGTLIIGIRDAQKIREVLSVPEEETIVSVIAVGIPAEEPNRPKRKGTEDSCDFFQVFIWFILQNAEISASCFLQKLSDSFCYSVLFIGCCNKSCKLFCRLLQHSPQQLHILPLPAYCSHYLHLQRLLLHPGISPEVS